MSSNEYCIEVPILDDLIIEGNEIFQLQLVTDDPAVDFTDSEVNVTVLDNDGESLGQWQNG